MNKTVITLISFFLTLPLWAQEDKKKNDFDDFIKEANKDFDNFIDSATQDFIQFMRDPWTQLNAESPVEKRKKPEPVEPTVYDPTQGDVGNDIPICLNIDAILDQSTEEGKQRPTTKVNDIDDIFSDLPDDPTVIRKKPTVVVVEEEEKVVTPKAQPISQQVPDEDTPSQQPAEPPSEEAPAAMPNVSPVAPASTPANTPATSPALDTNRALYAGGSNRSKFVYAGNTYYLSNQLKGTCALSGVSESNVADAYEKLSQSSYSPLVNDLKELKSNQLINDWMTCMLVKEVAQAYCSSTNAATLMRYFLLSELGYKTRLARKATGSELVLFINVDCQLYGCIYITVDGQKYYDVENKTTYSFLVLQADAPKSKAQVSMAVNSPIPAGGSSTTNIHQAKGSSAVVCAPVPTQLMDVYSSYPQCDYQVYVTAAVNTTVAEAILTPLAEQVKGKSEADAANLLLNFVQTGFEYATDDQQFGYEKPFFVEELFYYPYCDCEDRSALYGYLVKNLLGLDVVYLDYPDHIATAVHFTTDPGGDYFNVGGKRYTICDPTYIGASIGMTIPQYRSASCTILKY